MYYLFFILIFGPLFSDLQKVNVEMDSQITLDNKILNYRVVSGNIILKNDEDEEKASICYTAYFLQGIPLKERPLSFCFNGGPGAASVWINTGYMGPKRIEGEDIQFLVPPYSLVDNESSLLDKTDMVFIDPVSTGFSRPAPTVEVSAFHNVEEDVAMMGEFIRVFTSQFKRFDSPKYLVGESYGGLRAAKVGYKLHEDYGYYLNGILLISPALDLQPLSPAACNDLPYILALPSLTAVANYHKKTTATTSEAEEFASTTYAEALFLGDSLASDKKKELSSHLSYFTGLDTSLIERLNFRIPNYRFIKECMQNEGKVIGVFDGRILGLDTKKNDCYSTYDPSLDAVLGAVTGTFSQFLVKEMQWPSDKDYNVLLPLNWNWGKGNQYASAIKDLSALIAQNPKLKVVVMHGIYDLAVPFSSVSYALRRTGFPERIQSFTYPGGHMMYYNKSIRETMRKDLKEFFL